jgi:hypothetical protein
MVSVTTASPEALGLTKLIVNTNEATLLRSTLPATMLSALTETTIESPLVTALCVDGTWMVEP